MEMASEDVPTALSDSSMFQSPLWQLTLARLRESVREPMALFWVYAFPLILALVLGLAFRNRPLERIVVDVRAGDGATAVVAMLSTNDRLEIEIYPESESLRRLQRGETDLIVIPRDEAGLDYWVEPDRPESALARYAVDSTLLRNHLDEEMPQALDPPVRITGGRYIDFLIPGLVAMNLMGGGLWGVGFVIVDFRIRKLLKRFQATPMRRTDFLLSLMVSRLLFMISEVTILLLFGWWIFGVGVVGSLLLLGLVILLGGACFSGVGMLLACRATRAESVSGMNTLVMLTQFVFSGIFFSAERFPTELQPFIQALPLTALADAMRAVMLDGDGFSAISGKLAVLGGWTVGSFVLALGWFRWR